MIVSEATEVRAAIAAEVAVVAMAERETECSGWSAEAIYCHQPVDGGDPSKGQNQSGPADSFWPRPTHPGAAGVAAAGGAEASSELGGSAPGDAVAAAAAAHGHATAGRAAGDAGGDGGPWWAETTAQATTVAAHIGGHGAGQQTKRIE